jgi:hypothetical protein
VMVCIQVERDYAASMLFLISRSGQIDVAVATDGEMAYRTQPFRDNAGVKAWRERQAIRFLGGREGDSPTNDQNGTQRSHTPLSPVSSDPT